MSVSLPLAHLCSHPHDLPLLPPTPVSYCTHYLHTNTSILVSYCHPTSTLQTKRKIVRGQEVLFLKHSHMRFDSMILGVIAPILDLQYDTSCLLEP